MPVEPTTRVIVFLGPSMPLEEAKSVIDAHFLPPARQADLLSAVHNLQPDIIGLVDGEFSQALSVWHKEILYALSKDIRVYGAASMGALRAAETRDFGMVGVGKIFSLYRDGILRDDDEVALQYAPASDGYRNLSMPMINIRATLEQAMGEDRIEPLEHDLTVSLAKALFFRDRTANKIHNKLVQAGLEESSAERIRESLLEHYVDLKQADTRELLETMLKASKRSPPQRTWTLNRSPGFRTLTNRDRKVRHSEVNVSLGQVARYAALHDPEFNEHNFNARNRVLALLLAELLDVRVDASTIDAEMKRFRVREQLRDDRKFEYWLARNDINERAFLVLMEEIAACRALHRWLTANESDAISTRALLDELRLCGRYPEAANRAASLADLADSIHPQTTEDDSEFADLVAEHLENTDWALDTDCKDWAGEAGYRNMALLRRDLQRSRSARSRVARLAGRMAKEIFSTTLEDGGSKHANLGEKHDKH